MKLIIMTTFTQRKKYVKEILNSRPEFVLYFNEFKLIDNRKEDTPVTKNKY